MKEKLLIYSIPALALAGLIIAGLLALLGHHDAVQTVLEATLIIGVLPLLWSLFSSLMRGHFGVDLIAVTAIVSSFFLRQYLAGTVVVLMMSGGEALEQYALARAKAELTQLLSRAPTVAHIKAQGKLADSAANFVKPGDILVIKPGETIPVDGVVVEGTSDVDESAITGESVPVEKGVSSLVVSGTINKDGVLEVRALKAASESKYEQIIRLVKQAQDSKAPIVRLADRYSVWFNAITFVLAGGAWLVSHDALRLLSVLVVATPCPLILATPIAVMSGISWAASRGIIVKSGGALEKLGEARSFVFDKTGTLTLGIPKVLGAESSAETAPEDILHIAASLDQLSAHIFARSLVRYAKTEGKLSLEYPDNFEEHLGEGVSGEVGGKKYLFGKLSFLEKNGVNASSEIKKEHERKQDEGKICVYLSRDGKLLGNVMFADVIRPEIKSVFHSMKKQGIQQLLMLTGDRKIVAEKVASEIGLEHFEAELLPEQKVEKVKSIRQRPVVMVGDGINDAPALAGADVGVALGVHGATAASDAGDIVVMVNNMERVAEALTIAKRVLHIARQSIFVGMGLSVLLMIIAAFGYIIPVVGALLQEALDVLVILNALRVHFEKKKKLF